MGLYYLRISSSDATCKKFCNLHRLASEILLFTQRERQLTDRGGSGAIGLHRHLSFLKLQKNPLRSENSESTRTQPGAQVQGPESPAHRFQPTLEIFGKKQVL